MPSLGVCVMAHPKRESSVRKIANKIDTRGLVAVWDTKNDVYDTGRRSWLEGVDSDFTHWLVLQDDAIICNQLVAGVESALEHVNPSSPLSLYIGKSRPYAIFVQALVDKTVSRDASFITMNKINWGVGLVVPVIRIPSMIDFCDRRSDKMYDRRLGKYFLEREEKVWYTFPSLIDHENGLSLLDHRHDDRRAYNFIGREGSALDVDWGKGVVHGEESKSRRKP